MTISHVKREIDKKMQDLTPEEMAKYVMNEEERIIGLKVTGKDTTREDEQLDEFYTKYVLRRDIYDYAAFLRAINEEERASWARFWINTAVPSLVREQALVTLLIREKVLSWNLGIKGQKEQEKISELIDRFEDLYQEIKILFEFKIWEKYDMARPEIPENFGEVWIGKAQDIVAEDIP